MKWLLGLGAVGVAVYLFREKLFGPGARAPFAPSSPIYNDPGLSHQYVGESFVPYQMPDGTFINSQAEQDAWTTRAAAAQAAASQIVLDNQVARGNLRPPIALRYYR